MIDEFSKTASKSICREQHVRQLDGEYKVVPLLVIATPQDHLI